jgi:hypothetical protein
MRRNFKFGKTKDANMEVAPYARTFVFDYISTITRWGKADKFFYE